MSWPPDFSQETREETEARMRAAGWIQVNSNRWILRSEEACARRPRSDASGFAIHDLNYTKDGRFKFHTHGRKDTGDQPCIVDMADPIGRKTWPHYVRTDDGREGPAPFRTAEEQRSYMKLTGKRFREKGEPDFGRSRPSKAQAMMRRVLERHGVPHA